jgi:CubicO group peptidase (beta-lactamase class C family)
MRFWWLFLAVVHCLAADESAGHLLPEGCSAGVLRKGEVVFAERASKPMYLASVSKQFTAAAVFRLVEQRKVRLRDPITARIPELGPAAAGVTVEHLLHHTSGLRDYSALQEVMGSRENLDNSGVVRLLARQRELNFAPGTDYEYSNSEYVLLGVLIERASGVSLDEFVRREFFEPLKMTQSRFGGSEGVPRTLGDGGMFSTVDDLLRWMQRPPGRIAVRARLRTGERLPHAAGLFWGRYHGRTTLSHNGVAGEYQADMVHFPNEALSVVCLCNGRNSDAPALSRQIADAYLGQTKSAPVTIKGLTGKWISRQGFLFLPNGDGKLEIRRRGRDTIAVGWEGDRPTLYRKLTAEELRTAPPENYKGRFSNDELGVTFDLVVADGALTITNDAGWRIPLEAAARDRFSAGPWILEFDQDHGGFRLHRERLWSLRFRRRESAN